jgi:hypothetical protein
MVIHPLPWDVWNFIHALSSGFGEIFADVVRHSDYVAGKLA